MAAAIVTWRDIPTNNIVQLLGEYGNGLHPRDIHEPEALSRQFGIPLELLPVREIIADKSRGIVIEKAGRLARCIQGVVAGDLIDAIANGLGVEWPADARRGYSGGRLDLAAAIVRHIKAA